MAELHILEELRAYLIAQSVVQDFNTAPSLTVPSVLLDPIDGAPLPRTGENATVTLRDTMLGGPVGQGAEAYLEEAFIDVIVRARNAPAAKLVHRTIRGLLHPIGDHRGKQDWTMGALHVELSTTWRGEQPLDFASDQLSGPGTARPKRVGWGRVAAYRFEVRRTALST